MKQILVTVDEQSETVLAVYKNISLEEVVDALLTVMAEAMNKLEQQEGANEYVIANPQGRGVQVSESTGDTEGGFTVQSSDPFVFTH